MYLFISQITYDVNVNMLEVTFRDNSFINFGLQEVNREGDREFFRTFSLQQMLKQFEYEETRQR